MVLGAEGAQLGAEGVEFGGQFRSALLERGDVFAHADQLCAGRLEVLEVVEVAEVTRVKLAHDWQIRWISG